jgi:Ca2+-binding EF-hand superfamily protein
MNRSTMLLAMALMGAGACAMAADDTKMGEHMDMKMHMKMMDTNGDGMISKDEFMKYHEMMFDKMKKNKAGMVDIKEFEMMHHDMEHKSKAIDKDAKTK